LGLKAPYEPEISAEKQRTKLKHLASRTQ